MKKVFLSLAIVAALTVVSCKQADAAANEAVDTTVAEAVDTAASMVDTAAAMVDTAAAKVDAAAEKVDAVIEEVKK
jgi:PBP1b-binding outer membrane lipoprotein LpoB